MTLRRSIKLFEHVQNTTVTVKILLKDDRCRNISSHVCIQDTVDMLLFGSGFSWLLKDLWNWYLLKHG